MENDICENYSEVVEENAQEETEEERKERIRSELTKQFEAEIDRRIEGAHKKFLRSVEKKKAVEEAEANKVALEEARKRAEEVAAQELSLRERELRLNVVDLVAENGMDGSFRTLIAYRDLISIEDPVSRYQKLMERVIDLKCEFSKAVRIAVEQEKRKFFPEYMK